MEYYLLKEKPVVRVRGLYSLYYFQFNAGYAFKGEQHDFWELVYVDTGETDIGAGGHVVHLGQGQAIFHAPGEFHSVWTNAAEGANLCIVTFECKSAAMRAFRGRLCTLSPDQRLLLQQIVAEGQRMFGPALDIGGDHLVPRPDAPIGGSQKLVLYLELLLLELLRTPAGETPPARRPQLEDGTDFAARYAEIERLMRAHLDGTLRFPALCRALGMSETVLKKQFKRFTGVTVMERYQRIRITEAKRMLRAGGRSAAQIADALGYSSPAAFSRQFVRLMGMTPGAYVRSIRS